MEPSLKKKKLQISYTHLLLTRFNLNYSSQDGKPYRCDEKWHHHRFNIFINYTLPSVQGQSSKKFKWIIFFNENLTSAYGEVIAEIVQKMPEIEFIYVKEDQDHIEILHQNIKETVSSQYLLTTRLDNDDVISKNLIKEVQEIFFTELENKKENDFIINAGKGYQKEIIFPYRKSVIEDYRYSPFISLISNRSEIFGFRTVLDKPHHEWNNLLTTLEMDRISWIQLIHEQNLANHVNTLNHVSKISNAEFPFLPEDSLLKSLSNSFFLPLQIAFSAALVMWEKVKSRLKNLLLDT